MPCHKGEKSLPLANMIGIYCSLIYEMKIKMSDLIPTFTPQHTYTHK